MKFIKGWGWRLLAAWLILYGVIQVAQLTFQHSNLVLGALAIAAGVLIMIER
jgi:hypothetical protein